MAGDYVGEDTAATTAGGYMLNRYLGKTNCLTNIPQDINLTLDPLNVIVVGSPTVSDRIFSGFSASNYLTLPKVFNPSSNTWEIVLKVKMGNSVSDARGLMGASNGKDYQCFTLVTEYNKLYLYMSSNGTSWDIASRIGGNTTFSSSTYYYIKLAFTGSAYVLSYSESGSTWNTEVSVSSTAKVYASAGPLALGYVKYKSDSTQYFHGSIDLKGSYMKINGSVWWQSGTGNLTLKKGSKVYIPNGWTDYKYYKYTYEDWTQPVMSSNYQDGVKLTYANMSSSNIYTLFNGVSNSDYITPTSTTSYASYVDIAFDYPVKLSNIKINSYTKINVTYAFGECKIVATTKEGQEITISTAKLPDSQAWTDTNFPVDNLVIKNLRIYATSGGNPHPRIGEITLTAQKQTGSVESTSSDYDYKVGSGSMVFDEVVIESDVSHSLPYGGTRTVCFQYKNFESADGKGLMSQVTSTECFSGSTAPTAKEYMLWYDTVNNIIKWTNNYGSNWYPNSLSLPFCKVNTIKDVGITGIDQIFNGFGYIGSTVFALPNVKGLIPNGFNKDGTYKSIKCIVDKVFTYTYPSSWTRSKQPLFIAKNGAQFTGTSNDNYFTGNDKSVYNNKTYVTFYDTKDNIMYHAHETAGDWQNYNCFFVGYAGMELGKITSLTPATVKTTNDYSRHLLNYNGTYFVLRR